MIDDKARKRTNQAILVGLIHCGCLRCQQMAE
jgi:hypothetical protein